MLTTYLPKTHAEGEYDAFVDHHVPTTGIPNETAASRSQARSTTRWKKPSRRSRPLVGDARHRRVSVHRLFSDLQRLCIIASAEQSFCSPIPDVATQ